MFMLEIVFFPNHISSPNYDSHVLDDFVSKSAKIIASEYLRNYENFNSKYQIQYIRLATKSHFFQE